MCRRRHHHFAHAELEEELESSSLLHTSPLRTCRTSEFNTALEMGGPCGTAYRARFDDGLVATVRRGAASDRDHEEREGAFYQEEQLLGCLNHCDVSMRKTGVLGFWCLIRWKTEASRNAYMAEMSASLLKLSFDTYQSCILDRPSHDATQQADQVAGCHRYRSSPVNITATFPFRNTSTENLNLTFRH